MQFWMVVDMPMGVQATGVWFRSVKLWRQGSWHEEVAALVVVLGSGLRFPGFAGLDAPRDMFTTFAGRKWP